MSNRFQFGWRIAAIAALGMLIWSLLAFTFREAADYLEMQGYGQSIEDYDYYLYDGEYARMRERLGSANPRGEEFALYWDVADAYWYYELCEFWRLAAGDGGADTGAPLFGAGTADGAAYEEKYRERLLHIYENGGEAAGRYIRGFAGALLP